MICYCPDLLTNTEKIYALGYIFVIIYQESFNTFLQSVDVDMRANKQRAKVSLGIRSQIWALCYQFYRIYSIHLNVSARFILVACFNTDKNLQA